MGWFARISMRARCSSSDAVVGGRYELLRLTELALVELALVALAMGRVACGDVVGVMQGDRAGDEAVSPGDGGRIAVVRRASLVAIASILRAAGRLASAVRTLDPLKC